MLALPNIEIKQFGRNKKGHRVMLVLSMLQATYNGSDSYTAEELKENIYWQYFCGAEYFQFKGPFAASSLTKWRNRFSEVTGAPPASFLHL